MTRDDDDAEAREQAQLAACVARIGENLETLDRRLNAYAREIKESKDHMWEARRDMDHIDKAAMRQSIEQKMRSGEVLRAQREKLGRLRRSPYFGRFDFARDADAPASFYIGVHNFHDEIGGENVVHDWRAPVASMFYDYELGPARYEAPSGEISGRIALKRQFRIREGRMEFMLDSGVNIVDDLLQQDLSRASDDGMRNIVATIQRDQNAIIRNADAHTLIIQGVAGSGKTSIALHRIAFLLYRFKETLRAQDILILSPNRVFADYIGNVLPELGEEQVAEIGVEALADALLGGGVRFESFFDQAARLLEDDDPALRARIEAKASVDFLKRIDAWLDHLEKASFTAVEWRAGRRQIVPAWFFEEAWRKQRRTPYAQRVTGVVAAAQHQIRVHYDHDLSPEERRSLREAVRGMARRTTLRAAYKGLFDWIGAPELFRPSGGKIEYADVFPMIHMKMRLEGVDNPHKDVRHLLIDEMQDYAPLQYAVLGRLFSCPRTILGDAAQAVSPCGASTAADIERVLRASPPVRLLRSYRSTWQIMQFALRVAPNADLIPIERHGAAPEVAVCKTQGEMVAEIAAQVADFRASDHVSLAIIARSPKAAAALAKRLAAAGVAARLLDSDSVGFSTGVIVCAAHLAKGLEFDRVIVADVSANAWARETDRNLLYVACTRAMHRLSFVAVGAPSPLLPVSGAD